MTFLITIAPFCLLVFKSSSTTCCERLLALNKDSVDCDAFPAEQPEHLFLKTGC